MKSFFAVLLAAVLLIAGIGAYKGYNQLRADMAALESSIIRMQLQEPDHEAAAGSIVMAHRAFASDMRDLRQAVDELNAAIVVLGRKMEKADIEREHLHDNITKVMIKLNRLINMHPNQRRLKWQAK